MNYTKKHNISKDAQSAFERIFNSLTAKAIREKKIPTIHQFWMDTTETHIVEELTKAGLIAFDFTEHGKKVYRHKVDEEGLREALGWTKN